MTFSTTDYLWQAYRLAHTSKDRSTQNAAILVQPNGIIAWGVNDIPPGVCDTDERRVYPGKAVYTEHAERAAVYDAARRGEKTDGAVMYCPWFACAECARAII